MPNWMRTRRGLGLSTVQARLRLVPLPDNHKIEVSSGEGGMGAGMDGRRTCTAPAAATGNATIAITASAAMGIVEESALMTVGIVTVTATGIVIVIVNTVTGHRGEEVVVGEEGQVQAREEVQVAVVAVAAVEEGVVASGTRRVKEASRMAYQYWDALPPTRAAAAEGAAKRGETTTDPASGDARTPCICIYCTTVRKLVWKMPRPTDRSGRASNGGGVVCLLVEG